MAVVFGKGFTRSFSVEDAEGETIALDSLVSGRIYSDSPSEAEREDDADALGTAVERVTSWVDGPAEDERQITYSALADTDQHSTSNATYYEVVSYKFESGGTTKHVTRAFTVIRPHSIESRIRTEARDIAKLESEIYNEDGTGQKSAFWVRDRVQVAKDILLRRLEGMDIERRWLKAGDLDNMMLFLATAQCCLSLMSETGDIWDRKYELYTDEFESILKREKIGVDVNEDSLIEPIETKNFGAVILTR